MLGKRKSIDEGDEGPQRKRLDSLADLQESLSNLLATRDSVAQIQQEAITQMQELTRLLQQKADPSESKKSTQSYQDNPDYEKTGFAPAPWTKEPELEGAEPDQEENETYLSCPKSPNFLLPESPNEWSSSFASLFPASPDFLDPSSL